MVFVYVIEEVVYPTPLPDATSQDEDLFEILNPLADQLAVAGI